MGELQREKMDRLAERLIGEHADFTLENRVFNAVCLITMIVLLSFTILNITMLGAYTTSVLFALSFVVLCYLYYVGRYKKKFKQSVNIYSVIALGCIIVNFFYNDGIQGPTVLAFFMSFQFIIALKPQKQYWLWWLLHILIVLLLFVIEDQAPHLISYTYDQSIDRIVDTWVTYVLILTFIFLITLYIRNNYNLRRIEAEDKATAIAAQNWQIAVQNEQLERLNAEKNKLFSIISHDLKSPLDTIKGYLELLTEQTLEEEEKNNIKHELLALTGNTSDMLVNLLTWAKAQMEGAKMNIQSVNLLKTLRETLEIQTKLARKKNILLTYSLDTDVCIKADHDMLQLVIRNLVNNAVKFTSFQGNILVSQYTEGSECIIAVKDNGQGIPADKQKDIFSLRSSTYGTNNEKGVGLGLALCKEFVEKQGGRLWFESSAGTGTTFYVAIPVANN